MRTSITKLVAVFAVLTGVLISMPVVSAAGPGTAGVTVTVPGNSQNGQAWVDTGIVLAPGVSVTVTAAGTACIDPQPVYCSGPNGLGFTFYNSSLPTAPVGSLIGRIAGGTPFAIGAGPTTFSGSGPLQFAQNDSVGQSYNNSGSFAVTITFTLTSTDACKDGGYQHFAGLFKNQGDCVAFVATDGKNPPSGA